MIINSMIHYNTKVVIACVNVTPLIENLCPFYRSSTVCVIVFLITGPQSPGHPTSSDCPPGAGTSSIKPRPLSHASHRLRHNKGRGWKQIESPESWKGAGGSVS